jgi:hypothetical protein
VHRAGQAELSGRYVCRLRVFMAVLGGDQLLVVGLAPVYEDVGVRVGRDAQLALADEPADLGQVRPCGEAG